VGEEIIRESFTEQDFEAFQHQLREQTAVLKQWFEQGTLSTQSPSGGFELEAWLVDRNAQPVAINEQYLQELNNPLVVAELSRFNVELNGTPQQIRGDALSTLQNELQGTWQRCREAAHLLDSDIMMMGILPTLQDSDLCPANMSKMLRYEALNEQVLKLRQGKPLHLNINGHEHLDSIHHDVMLEAAATSFQIHMQIPGHQGKRYYNAALVAAAPLLAMSTNSPFLFGKRVWEETRIPLFEQAVELGGMGGAAFGPLKRVSFGSGYVHKSLYECYAENLEHFPVLLPLVGVESSGDGMEKLPHLRMHNGTIWRWVRPLIGFDKDGTPHLRIEQRVVPSGPTVTDAIANAAMFFGLMQAMVKLETPLETQIGFPVARDNFYAAAKSGLHANLKWCDKQVMAQHLLLDELIPMARDGLLTMGVNRTEIDHYLGVIQARIAIGQTGSLWQQLRAQQLDGDLQAMTQEYLHWQESGKPVHEWPLQ